MHTHQGQDLEDLLERARGGSRAAFNGIVSAHHRALVGYVLSRTRASAGDADDIAQEVWMQVWRHIRSTPAEGGYDPEKASFLTYVRARFARFAVRRWASSRSRLPRVAQSVDPDSEREPADRTEDHREGRPEDGLIVREDLQRKRAVYTELLRLVFLCGGYPHQQLCFGFSKLLLGTPSPRGIEGLPGEVHARYGSSSLADLCDEFVAAYGSEFPKDDTDSRRALARHLSPLRARLSVTVERLLERDRASREQPGPQPDRLTGDTGLEDWYGRRRGGHATAIPDWCYKVERRIRRVLGAIPGACGRCKLRHLPPCDVSGPPGRPEKD